MNRKKMKKKKSISVKLAEASLYDSNGLKTKHPEKTLKLMVQISLVN